MTWDRILNSVQQIADTSLTSMELFIFTLIFALPLGLIFTYGRMSSIKPIRWVTQLYLLVMRGTPLMLQLIFFFYGTGLSRMGLDRLQVAIVAFSLNYAAYFAEIYRGGIQSMPVGQSEAANVLGFSRAQTFFHITMPQVIKKILPPMGNEFITLVKDTSLAQVIGVIEMTSRAQKLTNTTTSIIPIAVAGVFYLAMNAVVSAALSLGEKKLSYYN